MSEPSLGTQPIEFNVTVERTGDAARVSATGELDIDTAPTLEQALDDLRAEHVAHLVLDLRGLTFLGSSGIRIVARLNAAAARHELHATVIRGGPRVQRIFEIAGLADLPVFVDAPH